jgi:polyhydroxyalkanoate synthesis regulator phasin
MSLTNPGQRTWPLRLAAVGWVAASVALLCTAEATAQLAQAIGTKDLVEPWNRAAEIMRSLTHSFASVDEQEKRRLDRELSALDVELSELESEEQTVAIKIVSRPEFAYVVSENSDRLAKQLAGIEKRFDGMFDALSVSRRTDVLALKESLAALRTGLSTKNGLEHDVLQALGAGSRNQIQSLAASWWDGSESVGRLREGVAVARRELTIAAEQ